GGTGKAGAALAGTPSLAAVAGVATFGDLSIDSAGQAYTLTATSGSLPPGTSSVFDITPGAATRLQFTVQPSNTAAGATITPAVRVTARDGKGNVATGFTDTVTVAIGTNPGGATLAGTAKLAAVAGVATFGNLSLNRTGTGYTLTANGGAPALPQATSA